MNALFDIRNLHQLTSRHLNVKKADFKSLSLAIFQIQIFWLTPLNQHFLQISYAHESINKIVIFSSIATHESPVKISKELLVFLVLCIQCCSPFICGLLLIVLCFWVCVQYRSFALISIYSVFHLFSIFVCIL